MPFTFFMIKIRPAKIRDAEAIASLHLEMMKMHRQFGKMFEIKKTSKQIAEDWFKKVPRRKKNKLLVAEIDEEVVGYLWAKLKKRPSIYKDVDWGEIADLYVSKNHRRKGIGKKLVTEILKWFKEKKIKTIDLYVASDNEVANKVWKYFKFKEYFKKMYREL